MKVVCALPATIVVSVALIVFMYIRKTELSQMERNSRFLDTKLHVTYDVLQDQHWKVEKMKTRLDKTQKDQQILEGEVIRFQAETDAQKGQAEVCKKSQKSMTDEVAAADTELQKLKAKYDKEIINVRNELETLKRKLGERSAVCGFLKTGAEVASCGNAVTTAAPKPEEPKAAAPKPEEPKAAAPKPEEPKAAAPKPEEPKATAPKPEEPKAAAPKPEEPKAAAPKPEEPKAAAPKPEQPKAAAPKPEQPKAEPPKPEQPKAAPPKP